MTMDMTPKLAIEEVPKFKRTGGKMEEDGTRFVLVMQLNGKTMCPLANFTGADEAEWATKLLGELYGSQPTTDVARAPQGEVDRAGLGDLIDGD